MQYLQIVICGSVCFSLANYSDYSYCPWANDPDVSD